MRKIEFAYSFDDGGKEDLRIIGLLQKYKLSATFYIVVDWVGKEGFLDWKDVQEIDRLGFKIGSHSVTHPQDLKILYDEQLYFEIQNSKDMIETVLGHNIDSFCYPRGRADERVKGFVAEAGYVEARGTGKPGITFVKDRLHLPGTIHVFQRPEYGNESILEFAKKIIDKVKSDGGYCNIWAHGAELEKFSLWGVLDEILRYSSDN